MCYKTIIPYINAENEIESNVIQLSNEYEQNGADEIFLYNYAKDDVSKEQFLSLVKIIAKENDLPIYIGMEANRFEDIKKALYTGATSFVMRYKNDSQNALIMEASKRFGSDKIILEIDASVDKITNDLVNSLQELGVNGLLLKHVTLTESMLTLLKEATMKIWIRDDLVRNELSELLKLETIQGVATNYFVNKDIIKAKLALKQQNINVNTFESSMQFSDFKLNAEGLLPVVVQDYKTNEVLMVAYMNEEAFMHTVSSGKMTYYSRSRKKLWIKGETSSHYQYVKSLTIDCDKDTLLAKVRQIGAACHTGNSTCFYQNLVTRSYDNTNPRTVLNDVYDVIMDRKKNPKEGSYTNYLFDKGIDKILKKCGEESTEIVIAAKNPDAEELKYEISDYLYHLMVLMAQCNLDWDDVMKELAHRR